VSIRGDREQASHGGVGHGLPHWAAGVVQARPEESGRGSVEDPMVFMNFGGPQAHGDRLRVRAMSAPPASLSDGRGDP